MFEIRGAEEARADFNSLPLRIQVRVQDVFDRLTRWPNVSGVKPLRGSLKGAYRIRTGDWRLVFTVDEQAKRVTVIRIKNRRDVYDD
jgi:mRNA interferase RelE/StbE